MQAVLGDIVASVVGQGSTAVAGCETRSSPDGPLNLGAAGLGGSGSFTALHWPSAGNSC